MSLKNKIQDKTSLASGDNLTNLSEERIRKPKKIATPSSRRFGTKCLSDSTKKLELSKAIDILSSPVVRKKSLTLAEITPTRNKDISNENPSNEYSLRIKQKQNKQIAGRRIYEALLLHSWRRRKVDITLLTESLRALETQNRKLELQIDALHRLRVAECEKRNEAVRQIQQLHRNNEEVVHKNNALKKEKQLLHNEVSNFREKLTDINLQYENIRNDLIEKHVDLENSEYQLGLEKRKTKRLRDEKKSLEEQETVRKQEIQNYREQIEEMRDKLLNTEIHLQDSIVSNDSYRKENEKLSGELEVETCVNRRLQEDNEKLKFCLFAIKRVLKKEKNRPWWKNAGELGLAFITTLKTIAVVSLPIMTQKDTIQDVVA